MMIHDLQTSADTVSFQTSSTVFQIKSRGSSLFEIRCSTALCRCDIDGNRSRSKTLVCGPINNNDHIQIGCRQVFSEIDKYSTLRCLWLIHPTKICKLFKHPCFILFLNVRPALSCCTTTVAPSHGPPVCTNCTIAGIKVYIHSCFKGKQGFVAVQTSELITAQSTRYGTPFVRFSSLPLNLILPLTPSLLE